MPRGFNTTGDLITRTADGIELNQLFNDYQEAVAEANAQRDALLAPLVFRTTNPADPVLQSYEGDDFEEASEFGEPVGIRPGLEYVLMGYKFKWYDKAGRFTWQFLADATREQVDSVTNAAIEADNRNVWSGVMGALLNNEERTNAEGHTVYPLWAGQTGDLPPEYNGETFADAHNHYVTTGNTPAELTQATVDGLMGLVQEHGYADDPSRGRLLLLAHRQEADVIRGFRTTAAGGSGKYDFIAGEGAPPYLTSESVIGDLPPATVPGGALSLIGAYGSAYVAQHNMVPKGYLVAVASGGANSAFNPVGMREHPTTGTRGLVLAKGRTPDYPLQDSMWVRGFGTGVRHRGAAAVLQVTASSTYTAPLGFDGTP